MRVIAGGMKGINIPFSNEKYDNANITPQKVKEALFSILSEEIAGRTFLDLYACSGQIGIEAVSRGAAHVVFNEIEDKRYKFIKAQIEKLDLHEHADLYRYHSFRCLRYLYKKNQLFDYIFIDPPYAKRKGDDKIYREIFDEFARYPVLTDGGRIIIQHFADND
ncbi:MAG: 23S rRNA (adenine(2030)-N(6))-methyltransferase RlmJ, partial [Spirochaetes bacterium]|nr:23S rRNA (adenine(2030)-N(6))-methyltransferase RlmJ [Spirochaetota bacterium]